jgi:transcriptional regulator with XRE-family HTH domain
MFYETYCELCQKHGLTPSGAAAKIGFNRASVTMWKNTGKAPKQELLMRIAEYFNVTTDYLLGKEEQKKPTPKSEHDGSEIMFALSRGGEQVITDEMFDEVKKFAAYIAQREQDKK